MPEPGVDDTAGNRALWEQLNEQVTDRLADAAWRSPEVVWGLFAVPDATLAGGAGALGPLAGRDVVELACGTAYLSAWMARLGARVRAAVDVTAAQLRTALRCQDAYGPSFPLLQADGERLPLAAACVDLVVSEHGVAAWCDPDRWVPEAARVLRPDGRLVFLTNSQLSAMCVPAAEGVAGERLLRGQRETARVRWPGGGVEHHPSHGDWVRVLRRHGFVVEALHELYAPAGAPDNPSYEIVSATWAARWPAEELWVARRAAAR